MSSLSPTAAAYGVRFVPESTERIKVRLSFDYIASLSGAITFIQLASAFGTFVVAVCSRSYSYRLSDLTVYVAPKATPLFAIISTFCLFYIDLLIVAAATLSNFDAKNLQTSFLYLLAMASGSIFCGSSAVSFLVTSEDDTDMVLGILCGVCGALYAFRSLSIAGRTCKHRQPE